MTRQRPIAGLLRTLAACLLATVTVGATDAGAQDNPAAFIARIEAAQVDTGSGPGSRSLAQLMQQLAVPGVSIAVIRDFRIHWAKGYGLADVGAGTPVDTGTAFQAASISKPVTAMALMKLVQDGRVTLDADVNTMLRSWRVPASEFTRAQPVTLRSLLSHTSGADDGFGFPGYAPQLPRPTVVQILNGESPSNVGRVTFARPPYQSYKYSGGGYTIVQLLMTDVTRQPFDALMREAVLQPLGMTRSSFEQPVPPGVTARASKAYNRLGSAHEAPWYVHPEQAAAGLWTTPSDLARFVIEVQRAASGGKGSVLTENSAREMLSPVSVGPFGIGFTLEKTGEGWYFGHGGSNRGFRAQIIGHVRKGYGVVIMTNSDNGGPLISEIGRRISAAYAWDQLDTPLRR
jgi:CubicO group peptidase (beta-lactamase class C family)